MPAVDPQIISCVLAKLAQQSILNFLHLADLFQN